MLREGGEIMLREDGENAQKKQPLRIDAVSVQGDERRVFQGESTAKFNLWMQEVQDMLM